MLDERSPQEERDPRAGTPLLSPRAVHALATPLHAVLGFAELLEEEVTAQGARYLGHLTDAARTLQALIVELSSSSGDGLDESSTGSVHDLDHPHRQRELT